ncbi:3-methylornithine--L-lysine ligase PylC [Acetohalobium arabaticum]|uniref:ATP-grasp domain-containing protein n=1 Tax=Acetohalobium arabaticum (strain ATCC 49924 / DSM 5501 / Z-7288) TaxID=574087 RepID=D9QUB3_ACEAZ|nr:3-methylornithine--L-lysine ligase PylC [Acetohalobium arabaticum]ADL11906.1 protein of unknown function DUF201 [Acetohalobium arabaticum DSM 5501]
MRRIAIIGGGLQGIEVTYLAQKAGYKVLLIDKRRDVPAFNLADETIICDIMKEKEKFKESLDGVDLILPTTENNAALQTLKSMDSKIDIPIVFDWAAYQITNSKEKSKKLFSEYDIPQADLWPKADFPLIIKPSSASGSQEVHRAENKQELDEVLTNLKAAESDLIIEEYLPGPSYSIEVIGYQDQILPLVTTYLDFDVDYDCRQVISTDNLEFIDTELRERLNELSSKIAKKIGLNGIMDLEVIRGENDIKVLEIDARFPSQTPITVFWATGLNMVELLVKLYLEEGIEPESKDSFSENKSVIYEHIKMQNEVLEVCGEHIISRSTDLRLERDFFGAVEAITNYGFRKQEWVATLIFTADSLVEAFKQRDRTLNKISEINSLSKTKVKR